MGRACAVPKCKTGYKSVKEKCSVFSVPKNPELFKKWQAAIPGIVLKQSQCVCEKHFEQKYVLKEWVGRDLEGRIIARVPYLSARLVESAVPTIFDNFITSVPSVSDKPTDGVFDSSNSLEDQCESFEKPPMDTLDAECADASCAMPCASQETIQHESLPVTPVPKAASASPNKEVVDSALIVRRKNFVLSNITIKDSTTNAVTSKKNPIIIPTSWGVTEYAEERGQRVVFSNILRTNIRTASTIIDKSVEVDPDKTLRYCVYGRLIDSEKFQLPPVLTDTTLLPKILETFRRLNVCQGLGLVNIHHLLVDSIFQDSVQQWRDNDCTILAKQKRCVHCQKMRQRIIRRESRSDETETINRIRYLSNPIDRRKIIALRKKIYWEKRTNNYLKRRLQLLNESLKEKAKEISSIRAETLEEKFSQLQVPASQQTAIKEIILAATRRDTKSRRYSDNWIKLCILMHKRSPSFYEFLRKNDVLPLPCIKTIRSYFLLKNLKNEQLGQLLKKQLDTKTEQQRHGVRLLDEINLQQSVAGSSRNLIRREGNDPFQYMISRRGRKQLGAAGSSSGVVVASRDGEGDPEPDDDAETGRGPEDRELHPAARGSAAVVTVRTAEEGEAEGAGGWHPQLAHLPQLPHPLRRKQTVGAAFGKGKRDKFKCLYLLVETAVTVRQCEKEEEEVEPV